MSDQAILPFIAVYASSEDTCESSVQELNPHADESITSPVGWQSEKFCDYPQELGFMINRGNRCRIENLEILSHESKIATRVEIYIGTGGSSYQTSTFTRLGFVELSSNDSTNFAARELKSVNLSTAPNAQFLKLVLHPCHVNRENLYNQVGIVALSMTGAAAAVATATSPASEIKSSIPTPPKFKVAPALNDFYLNDFNVSLCYNNQNVTKTMYELVSLTKSARDDAAAIEDFDLALMLKSSESQLRSIGEELRRLELEKQSAVSREQFETAKYVKIDIETQLQDATSVAHMVLAAIGDFEESAIPNTQPAVLPKKSRNSSTVDDRPVRPAKVKPIGQEENEDDNILLSKASKVNLNAAKYLSGIPNAEALPTPDLLSDSVIQDYYELIEEFGQFVIRCLLSRKYPTLREAAVTQIGINLENKACNPKLLSQLFVIVEIGLSDTNTLVFQAGCDFLQSVLLNLTSSSSAKDESIQLELLPMINLLVSRLGDGHPRIRDLASLTILDIAATSNAPGFTLSAVLKATSKNWIALRGVLRIAKSIVSEYHASTSSKISAKSILHFMERRNVYSHSSGEVREAAKDLCVVLYLEIGPKVQEYLSTLRPVQYNEYIAAFQNAGNA